LRKNILKLYKRLHPMVEDHNHPL